MNSLLDHYSHRIENADPDAQLLTIEVRVMVTNEVLHGSADRFERARDMEAKGVSLDLREAIVSGLDALRAEKLDGTK